MPDPTVAPNATTSAAASPATSTTRAAPALNESAIHGNNLDMNDIRRSLKQSAGPTVPVSPATMQTFNDLMRDIIYNKNVRVPGLSNEQNKILDGAAAVYFWNQCRGNPEKIDSAIRNEKLNPEFKYALQLLKNHGGPRVIENQNMIRLMDDLAKIGILGG